MGTNYVHFSKEQKEKARQTDLVSLLEGQGERLKRIGSEHEWEHGGGRITIRGNLWYDHYEHEGGDAVEFVKRYFEKNYPQAIEFLTGERGKEPIKRTPPIEKEEKAPFELPEKNVDMRRAYAYLLLTRGIDKEVLNAFISKRMIYESAKYHNAVFVGYDKNGVARHANMRSTSNGQKVFKGNAPNSVPEYSFHWQGKSDKLYVFEAPIDMMSFICTNKQDWQQHSYAACCGVGDRVVFQMLKDNPNLKSVSLCLDNDEPGREASKKMAAKLKGVEVEILVPMHKDWNKDLTEPLEDTEDIEEGELCRESQCLS